MACDSTQVYRGFDIGTAKPTVSERQGVPHHLIDLIEPAELFTAADYRRRAIDVLADLRQPSRLPIFTAGTGLYLRALLAGLSDAPARSSAFRARLDAIAARRGAGHLHRLLRRVDGAAAARISPQDGQKLVRALEIRFLRASRSATYIAPGACRSRATCSNKNWPEPATHAVVRAHREAHLRDARPRLACGGRVAARVFESVASLRPQLRCRSAMLAPILPHTGPLGSPDTDEVPLAQPCASPAATKPFEFIGYREMRAHIESGKPLPETIAAIAQATRRYAKRQLTWFRKEPGVHWFSGFGDEPEIVEAVTAEVERYLAVPLADVHN